MTPCWSLSYLIGWKRSHDFKQIKRRLKFQQEAKCWKHFWTGKFVDLLDHRPKRNFLQVIIRTLLSHFCLLSGKPKKWNCFYNFWQNMIFPIPKFWFWWKFFAGFTYLVIQVKGMIVPGAVAERKSIEGLCKVL